MLPSHVARRTLPYKTGRSLAKSCQIRRAALTGPSQHAKTGGPCTGAAAASAPRVSQAAPWRPSPSTPTHRLHPQDQSLEPHLEAAQRATCLSGLLCNALLSALACAKLLSSALGSHSTSSPLLPLQFASLLAQEVHVWRSSSMDARGHPSRRP